MSNPSKNTYRALHSRARKLCDIACRSTKTETSVSSFHSEDEEQCHLIDNYSENNRKSGKLFISYILFLYCYLLLLFSTKLSKTTVCNTYHYVHCSLLHKKISYHTLTTFYAVHLFGYFIVCNTYYYLRGFFRNIFIVCVTYHELRCEIVKKKL